MQEEVRYPPARIIAEPYAVDKRLLQLGSSRKPLIASASEGDLQRRLNSTPDDFYATGGFVGWARGLRVLRKEMRLEHGWHNGDYLRIPVTYNETETIAFAVSTGDERTGLPGGDPSTHAKGSQSSIAVELNVQGELFGEDEGVELWYLLSSPTSGDESLRIELSSPRFINDRFEIAGWSERIIIGEVAPTDGDRVVPEPIVDPVGDIQVRRKSA